MAFTTIPAAGAKLRASTLSALISEVRPLTSIKSADETVNNSATLQNDDQLFLSVAANTFYELNLRLIMNSNATANFKLQFTAPAGAGFSSHSIEGNAATALTGPGGAGGTYTGVAADKIVIVGGQFSTAGTAGTLQLQWAQNTANVSNTIVKANSYMTLRQIV